MNGRNPSILLVTTQTWLQVARLAVRFASLGCRVSALCPDESPLAFTPEVTRRFRYSPLHALGSLRSALEVSEAEYLVPTDDLSVWLLHDLHQAEPRFRSLIERSLGSAEHFATLSSRRRLLELARQLGIQTSDSGLIDTRADLDAWCTTSRLPFVLKKDGTWGGQGVHVVRSPAEAHDAFAQLQQKRGLGARAAGWLRNGDGSAFARPRCLEHPEMLAEGYVEGVPANSMYACADGRILGEVQARVAATRGRMGPSIVIQLIHDERIHQAGARIARALRLSGFFGLDFILERDAGEPYLIECNPRATQLGHLEVPGEMDLAGLLTEEWMGAHLPRPDNEGLNNSIWFYPDGKRLTQGSASFPGFRPDAPPDQMAVLERRMSEQAPPRVRLRRALWRTLVHMKGSVVVDERRKAFYYPSLASHAPGQESGGGGGRTPSVVFIAS